MKRITFIFFLLLLGFALSDASDGQQKNSKDSKVKKSLVVFFSRTGENYSVGNIKKGNTHIVAEMIAKETGADLFQIIPEKEYPNNYEECIALAKTEEANKARPQIKGDKAIENYDVIFIGYPIWWSDMPMPVYTFLEKHNWKGKIIVPFSTHEGSALASTPSYLKSTCKGSSVLEGIAIYGSKTQNNPSGVLNDVKSWLKELKF